MSSSASSLDRIAVIDLAPLADGSGAGCREVATALRNTLERIGFFIIVNHGVSQDLIDRAFAEARRFHAQPMEAKHAVLMNEHNNGYMASGRYNVRTSRVSETTAKPDLNEAFFIKRERLADDSLVKAGRRFAGPNEWPTNLPGFRETLLEYTDTVDAMARRLLPALAVSLDLPPDRFDDAFAESQFSFRLSHYPAVSEREAGQYGIAPHTDANFLTFLAQSGVPGLQARVGEDQWLDVPYVPGSFVVNSGDILHRWTNGRYQSTPHRALPPIGEPRYAIPYFFGPHMDTVIECLPTCQDVDNPPKYGAMSYSDYLLWWYDANYNAKDQADLSTQAAE
ncbi:MAG TPA: 2-oxoglutarate and iron-dependent oxygenase domain-containing protein [Alphaproteobacteria bacterium]|nr:2-oxoglutarate and iron-dependent oxygenase domain-containing protein [Alphaproteobacteria bacterium]